MNVQARVMDKHLPGPLYQDRHPPSPLYQNRTGKGERDTRRHPVLRRMPDLYRERYCVWALG